MTLNPGQKLGPYEIEGAAGAGGMGEVYKAKDTRLDRTVAIKVLPARTAMNADLRTRFEREARAISSLNHPNICTLYDVGHENETDYLVMEYLEGETLGELIHKGPIEVKQALEIAGQIADALDKAHRQGLIHRDLKPGNVILTKTGAKLLDFGLAKLQMSGGVVDGVSGVTQTTPLTGTGTIIGTIQYMSPEQLEGADADVRSDIFAFGALLYEMVTGTRAFSGKSQASLIASILKEKPRTLSEVMPMTPPALDRLVRKCLEKDPEVRWQSARDLSDEIRWISQSGSQAGLPAPVASRRKLRFRLGWGIAALAIVVAGTYAYLWYSRPEPPQDVVRFSIEPGPNFQSIQWPQLSPDGKFLAFKGTDSAGQQKIWLRALNSMQAIPLNGTEGSLRPFWSADSRYLAYTANRSQLKKVPINGGPPQLIGEFPFAADGAWGAKDIIVFDGGATDSIRYVAAGGGSASAATQLDHEANENLHAWPDFLPDGEHFIYLASTDTTINSASYMLKVGAVHSDETKALFLVSTKVEYCDPGYLLYVKDRILLAQRFDPDGLEVVGDPIPVAENIASPAGSAVAHFDASDNGTLVYMTTDASSSDELVWVDRDGRELEKIGSPGKYGDVALSPDGNSLVYGLQDPQTERIDLWMYDLNRRVSSRFTFMDGNEFGPLWTPDGSEILFNNGSLPRIKPYKKPSNGTGESTPLLDSALALTVVTDISSDGTQVCLTAVPTNNPDIFVKDLTKDEPSLAVVNSDRQEFLGRFSPDGRYLAYVAQETDRGEVYIRSLTGSGGRWQVSSDGFRGMMWNPNGKEFIYVNSESEFISVPINTAGELKIGASKVLFKWRLPGGDFRLSPFTMSPDGQKFLVVSAGEQVEHPKFQVVLNWPKTIENR
jgi:serine/threonine protein kinase/WD40 repeat protein